MDRIRKVNVIRRGTFKWNPGRQRIKIGGLKKMLPDGQEINVLFAKMFVEEMIKALNSESPDIQPKSSHLEKSFGLFHNEKLAEGSLKTLLEGIYSKMSVPLSTSVFHDNYIISSVLHEILLEILNRGRSDDDCAFLCCLILKERLLLPFPTRAVVEKIKKLVWDDKICLERAILMDKAHLFPLSTFLTNMRRNESMMIRLMEKIDNEPKSAESLHYLLCSIVAYDTENGGFDGIKQLRGEFQKELRNMKFQKMLVKTQLIESINSVLHPSKELLKKFHVDVVNSVINSRGETVEDAFKDQISWTFQDEDCNVTGKLLANCTGLLSVQELMAVISSFISSLLRDMELQREIKGNFKAFLLLVLEISLQHELRNHLLDFVESNLISESLDAEDITDQTFCRFQLGIIIARQLSREIESTFPSFGTWLHQAFGDQSRSLINNSTRRMRNFIELLTRIVPLETKAVFLRLHLSRPPAFQFNEKQSWNDYCQLVRTKLYDLSENSGKKSSVFTISSNTSEVSEVKEAAKKFRHHKKLPQFVIEASIFRRPYFLGSFLPTLVYCLKKPSDADPQIEDLKSLAIELYQKGKIPPQIALDIQSTGLKLQT